MLTDVTANPHISTLLPPQPLLTLAFAVHLGSRSEVQTYFSSGRREALGQDRTRVHHACRVPPSGCGDDECSTYRRSPRASCTRLGITLTGGGSAILRSVPKVYRPWWLAEPPLPRLRKSVVVICVLDSPTLPLVIFSRYVLQLAIFAWPTGARSGCRP